MSILEKDFDDQINNCVAIRVTVGSIYEDGFVIDADEQGNPVWIAKILSHNELGTCYPIREKLSTSTDAYPAFRQAIRAGWDLPSLEQMEQWFGKTEFEVQKHWRTNCLCDLVASRRYWCKTTRYDPNTNTCYAISFYFYSRLQSPKAPPEEKIKPIITSVFNASISSDVLVVKKII